MSRCPGCGRCHVCGHPPAPAPAPLPMLPLPNVPYPSPFWPTRPLTPYQPTFGGYQ